VWRKFRFFGQNRRVDIHEARVFSGEHFDHAFSRNEVRVHHLSSD
jgi:hypothetical protein